LSGALEWGAGSATAPPTFGALEECGAPECRILHFKFKKMQDYTPIAVPQTPRPAASCVGTLKIMH